MLQHLTIDQLKDVVTKAEALNKPKPGQPAIVSAGDLSDQVLAYASKAKPLRDCLGALSVEGMRELKALMWLGRGDYENFTIAHSRASGHVSDPESDAIYVADKSPLATYLRNGAEKAGIKL